MSERENQAKRVRLLTSPCQRFSLRLATARKFLLKRSPNSHLYTASDSCIGCSQLSAAKKYLNSCSVSWALASALWYKRGHEVSEWLRKKERAILMAIDRWCDVILKTREASVYEPEISVGEFGLNSSWELFRHQTFWGFFWLGDFLPNIENLFCKCQGEKCMCPSCTALINHLKQFHSL